MNHSDRSLIKTAIYEGIGLRINSQIKGVEPPKCTVKHKEKMSEILKGNITGKIIWTTRVKIVAALLAAAILLLTGCSIIYREEIFTFIIETTNIGIIFFPEKTKNEINFIDSYYDLGYLPEGYTFIESIELPTSNYRTYKSFDGNKITFYQLISSGTISSVTNENIYSSTIYIGNSEVQIHSGEAFYYCIWTDGIYTMSFNCTQQLTIEETEKIINGIVVKQSTN